MWRDRRWQMPDRDPIGTWVHGRIALPGDAAHPPPYMAQGAITPIESRRSGRPRHARDDQDPAGSLCRRHASRARRIAPSQPSTGPKVSSPLPAPASSPDAGSSLSWVRRSAGRSSRARASAASAQHSAS